MGEKEKMPKDISSREIKILKFKIGQKVDPGFELRRKRIIYFALVVVVVILRNRYRNGIKN